MRQSDQHIFGRFHFANAYHINTAHSLIGDPTYISGASPRTPFFIWYFFLGGKPPNPKKGDEASHFLRGESPRPLAVFGFWKPSIDRPKKCVSCLRFCSRLFLDHLKYPSSLGCASRRRIFGGLGKTLEQSPTRNILFAFLKNLNNRGTTVVFTEVES